MKISLYHVLEQSQVDQWTQGGDQLANDEIRVVAMETMLLQMSQKMFLTLPDEILYFHNWVISNVWAAGGGCRDGLWTMNVYILLCVCVRLTLFSGSHWDAWSWILFVPHSKTTRHLGESRPHLEPWEHTSQIQLNFFMSHQHCTHGKTQISYSVRKLR